MTLSLIDGLLSVALAMMRPLGLTLLFPLLQTGNLSSTLIRNGVLLAIVLPVLPVFYTQPVIHQGWSWLSVIPGELAIGLMLGFCAAIPFWAVDMAGFLIDTLRGATMGTVFNPAMSVQTSIFGLLFSQFLCALFFITGGFSQLLTALYDSYQYLPPGKMLAFNLPFLHFLLALWRMLYQLCLSFSLPAVLSMMLADLALGLLNRSAQQLNVFFLSMPVKSALALLLLLLSLPYAFHHYQLESETLYRYVNQWLASHG
ncbi:EscT/YscT/HrcT family type III secretion system export apparatus protein [Citrobacter braakii]|uniref:EscT/YscT/HrcT family type III secretion system export apparatus protein n=1 Tax=Citrobacter braakii TaxID=57706 RepID=UPI001429E53F|nr:EscT/YscT/HrcT family type III secretion system export apparatus protein [Citrobacter braakii]ECX2001990.1 EscT/YscT/HrcT family type III secretion system export apparatus protein [Salmonella enterica subsp. enterica serovar Newport]MBJ9048922.1 EscT/YscT/HrcT family type III secretion system export apparatus protein [Citrobacter braakii]